MNMQRDNIIEVIADAFEPGSLELLLACLDPSRTVYSSGDIIPSGLLASPELEKRRELRLQRFDKQRINTIVNRLFIDDPVFREKVLAHYNSIMANLSLRRARIMDSGVSLLSCYGNQECTLARKMEQRLQGFNFTKYFEGSGLAYARTPKLSMEGKALVVMVPYYRESSGYRQNPEKIRKRVLDKYTNDLLLCAAVAEHCLIISHVSIDPQAFNPHRGSQYFEGEWEYASIRAFYEIACKAFNRKGDTSERIQLVHGHFHRPYRRYSYKGSPVHNLNMGEIFMFDTVTGECEVHKQAIFEGDRAYVLAPRR